MSSAHFYMYELTNWVSLSLSLYIYIYICKYRIDWPGLAWPGLNQPYAKVLNKTLPAGSIRGINDMSEDAISLATPNGMQRCPRAQTLCSLRSVSPHRMPVCKQAYVFHACTICRCAGAQDIVTPQTCAESWIPHSTHVCARQFTCRHGMHDSCSYGSGVLVVPSIIFYFVVPLGANICIRKLATCGIILYVYLSHEL